MGLSETIVAAIIGALATMGTAIFQLVRNRAPSETRPKKNRTRSVLATIALMIGCIVGGYAWSALRAVSAKEELRATMQEEFTRQFAEFAARQNQPAATTDPAGGTLASGNRDAGTAESVALWFKRAGLESGFYWYVTACIAVSLLVYVWMPDTRRHSRIDQDDAAAPRGGTR